MVDSLGRLVLDCLALFHFHTFFQFILINTLYDISKIYKCIPGCVPASGRIINFINEQARFKAMIEYIKKGSDYLVNFRGIYLQYLVNLIILLIGFILGKLAGKIVARILHELEVDSIIKKASGVDVNLEHRLSAFVTYLIYFITIIIFLNNLGVATTLLEIIFIAVVIVVVISLVLATKDFIPNAFAGFYIYRKKIVKEGDIIKVMGVKGEVVHINLVETKLKTGEGDIVYIPNSSMTKTGVIKMKKKSKKARKHIK